VASYCLGEQHHVATVNVTYKTLPLVRCSGFSAGCHAGWSSPLGSSPGPATRRIADFRARSQASSGRRSQKEVISVGAPDPLLTGQGYDMLAGEPPTTDARARSATTRKGAGV
jgi:hypothetical protein